MLAVRARRDRWTGPGNTAGALSQRFGSKRELLLALARRESEALPGRLAGAPDVEALIELFAALAGVSPVPPSSPTTCDFCCSTSPTRTSAR
ncbi:hypothetical protein GCM10010168_36150 [Actinoplanes ianthinogenes]|uniref:TetR family transcriptional regulator n=1 Tax=Actinoplanes ianthinogenes TaxID=122358 RepID=A0ABM7M5E4_9ACTN|nr:hypothetical protein [Actinoplanes ianthinogenes]BCJ46863.1 hypothetical protein Aiant_75200 [Actinoplanes ianthinogenes]GGR14987.1 hypothetical protein GCM10010168_36150 [Actinoplanes ianthinogenes]